MSEYDMGEKGAGHGSIERINQDRDTAMAIATEYAAELTALREQVAALEVENERLRDALIEARYLAWKIVQSPPNAVIPGVGKYANLILSAIDEVIVLQVPVQDRTQTLDGLRPLSAKDDAGPVMCPMPHERNWG